MLWSNGVYCDAVYCFLGGVVLLALAVLTPSFHYIPKASLAAIIISAVLTMVDYRSVVVLWRVRSMFSLFVEHEILHMLFKLNSLVTVITLM